VNRLAAWLSDDHRLGPGGPAGRDRILPGMVWLLFIVFPLVDALTNRGSTVGRILTIVAAAAFVALYVWLLTILWGARRRKLRLAIVCGLALLAMALTLFAKQGWGYLFTYVAASTAVSLPSRISFRAVLGLTALGVICTLIAGSGAATAISVGASTIGVGLLMVVLGDLRMRNQELQQARAELAKVAVAEERARFARDLHDLLGHSLSVIAIKAELAGRLLSRDVDAAAAEVADVEKVARDALSEVRDAVSGYRLPTLDRELEGARMALSAAGIDASVERSPGPLDPEVEAVLAWAVREGATNVIRHSGARRCEVKVSAGGEGAAVEVVDDGAGCDGSGGECDGDRDAAGHGLTGLSERAAGLRGRLEAGALPGGGFRLNVSIPVSSQ
jgi:two-component system, NarL family, sensor histidine kinase DesK